MKKPLRSGYTTGACAAAAAKGAAQMLANQAVVSEVAIKLPAGVEATFQMHGQSFSAQKASCFVVKDAGDDPDVTNGAEVWATVSVTPPPLTGGDIVISGGTGIGRVTKPGLAVPPGEWAINPVPRRMIEESVGDLLATFNLQPSTFNIVISIPDGEERAKKTLNQRLGIIGGLSILGTTGIVRPISVKAWTDTIDSALDVARACDCETVVLSTGRTSEMAAQEFFTLRPLPFTLPEEAFIMMGDHVAYALRACALRGFEQPIIACQFAKLLKIACGYQNTHAAASELDLAIFRGWAEEAGLPSGIISIIANANTAREIAIASGFDTKLMELVADRTKQAATLHAPGIAAQPLLCGYDGTIAMSL
ncbi:MAG: cobalt-precorrin-5B (C(1))-methyltransferase CbiD [Desulfuromonadaceae bacterium]|nr:cobalt-precorrin-5B (C(1))-methyltransferase CbiD [Desulfuromonadaceae bacterium]